MSRIRNGSRLTAGFLGFMATLAVAFFIGNYLGDGEFTGQAGSGGNGTKTLPITLSYPSNELTPTHPVPLTATINNTTSQPQTFRFTSVTISSTQAGCQASWFRVRAISSNTSENEWWNAGPLGGGTGEGVLTFPPGLSPVGIGANAAKPVSFNLELVDNGTDQSACEGAPVKVRWKVTQ